MAKGTSPSKEVVGSNPAKCWACVCAPSGIPTHNVSVMRDMLQPMPTILVSP